MSELLLTFEETQEDADRENGYDDVFASSSPARTNIDNPRPLSNGLLFLVLSLADWEREKVALLKVQSLRGYATDDDDDSGTEEEDFQDTLFHTVQRVLRCLRC